MLLLLVGQPIGDEGHTRIVADKRIIHTDELVQDVNGKLLMGTGFSLVTYHPNSGQTGSVDIKGNASQAASIWALLHVFPFKQLMQKWCMKILTGPWPRFWSSLGEP